MKKNKEVLTRHFIITRPLKPFVGLFFRIKYKFKYKKYKDLKNTGPYLVLGNHTVPVDPILMGLSFPFHLYYFATEQIFNLGFISKILVHVVNPIKKTKSLSDLSAIRKAKKIVLEGGSVAVFPEGNVSYDGKTTHINPSIVKLVRLLNVPVIIYKTQGLYLSNPRWANYLKKGQSSACIEKIISPEEYKKLDDQELYDLLVQLLYVNAYEDQNKLKHVYTGKKIAEGLQRLVFIDFEKNIPFVMETKKDLLFSTKGDLKLKYHTSGLLSYNNTSINLVDINKLVIKSYIAYLKHNNENFLFTEKVDLEESTSNKKIKLKKHYLQMYKDKILFISKNDNELRYDDIKNIAIQGKRKLIIYAKDKDYLVKLNKKSSPYKYLLTYQYYLSEIKGKNNGEFYQFGLQ